MVFDGQEELVDITLATRELDPDGLGSKLARLDILGKASDGSIINIEVQIANQYDMDKRTMFYWARLYQGQLQKGQSYKSLSRTVTINVLDYRLLPGENKYHSMYSLYEHQTHHRLNRDMEMHFLELPKWKEHRPEVKSRLDKWVVYLCNTDPLEMEDIAMSEPAIRKALREEEIFLKQDKERYLYEMREKALWDEVSQLSGARDEGLKEGLKEGERKKASEIAIRLLQRGVSVAEIAEMTGLAEAEIVKLRH